MLLNDINRFIPREVKGHFTLETYENGKLINVYSDNNLIVNSARLAMGRLICGKNGASGINCFSLGTRGHDEDSNDILIPKPLGEKGYDEKRKVLFSEEQKTPYYWKAKWIEGNLLDAENNKVSFTQDDVDFVAKGNHRNDTGAGVNAENSIVPVNIKIRDTSIIYEFEIPEDAANGEDKASTIAFTEAGLYIYGELFSIKCFPASTKSPSISFKIKWKIIF